MSCRFIRLPELINRTGLSRSHLYYLISVDQFPRQINLCGGRAIAWIESEVDEWMKVRVQTSRRDSDAA